MCRQLHQEGCAVHTTSRRYRMGDGVRWWQADLADLAATRQLISAIEPDIIFHLAGAVGAGPQVGLVRPTYDSLLSSSVNLLVASADNPSRRIIFAGSMTEPAADAAEPVPSSPYAAAKWASCAYARMFHRLYGTPVVIVRAFMTYGPGQAPEKLVPFVIRSLLANEAPKLSSGRFRADWIYVADVIDGFVKAATAQGIEGQTFDLGTGELRSIRSLVTEIASAMNSEIKLQFGAVPDRPNEREWAATLLPAVRLRWAPTTPLKEGLRQTVAWYREARHATAI
ncbi:MAG: NAD-dependent epimerase/dehydratase family protein [Rhodospirillales bacterium]|nr:NAD-dependent epimerase/dehydratase family protein [Rhodospirillales bacterium]